MITGWLLCSVYDLVTPIHLLIRWFWIPLQITLSKSTSGNSRTVMASFVFSLPTFIVLCIKLSTLPTDARFLPLIWANKWHRNEKDENTRLNTYMHIWIHPNIYIYIYIHGSKSHVTFLDNHWFHADCKSAIIRPYRKSCKKHICMDTYVTVGYMAKITTLLTHFHLNSM